MKEKIVVFILLVNSCAFSQADLGTVIKGGEVLVNGLTILLKSKSEKRQVTDAIESVCVKNKLSDKILFRLSGKDEEGKEFIKELVIQKNGKECVFKLKKGVYLYEIIMPDNEVFKKGEFLFEEDIILTVKPD